MPDHLSAACVAGEAPHPPPYALCDAHADGIGVVVIVDDQQVMRELFRRQLAAEGHTVYVAPDGRSALDLVYERSPDLVLTDVSMPHMNGYELCRRIKSDSATRLIPVILITGASDTDARLVGFEANADEFLYKPVRPHELLARVRALIRFKRFVDDLDSAESMILAMARVVEARDAYTAGHCERMALYGSSLGREIGLSPAELRALHRGGYLHDVGKIAIPDAILLKPSALTTAEIVAMRQHTIIGEATCGSLNLLRFVRPIVRHHHERLDGSGYPDGLKGDAIPLLAQIMGIVDVFDALTTSRPYRPAISLAHACEELQRECRLGWRRRDLVEAFIKVAHSFPQSSVRTSPTVPFSAFLPDGL